MNITLAIDLNYLRGRALAGSRPCAMKLTAFDAPSTELARASQFLSGGAPAVDVYEDKDNFVVKAELPGMKKEDIDVSLHDGSLSISGERKSEEKWRRRRSLSLRTLLRTLPAHGGAAGRSERGGNQSAIQGWRPHRDAAQGRGSQTKTNRRASRLEGQSGPAASRLVAAQLCCSVVHWPRRRARPQERRGMQEMAHPAIAREENYVLTLEEIGNLAQEGGKPAETLMNVVALIARRFQTDVCSAYLLEPDRANLVLAATLGLRPECIGTLRMAMHEGLAGLVAEQVRPVAVEQVERHPRFKYFREAGEDAYQSFLGVPLIDQGVLQGVLVVQTIESRVFREDEIRMLVEAAAQVAPVVSEARTLDRFIAPAQERLWSLARNLWWSWDHDSTSLFRDLDPVRWRQLNHNPDLAADRDSAGEAGAPRRRTGAARPHQLRVSPPAGISAGGSHLGRDACRRSAAAAGGVFLRRVRIARIASDLFRRLGRARRRPHQERVRPGHSADRHRSVLRPGLFPAAAGSATAGSRKSICRPTSTSCPWSRRSATNGEPVTVQIETRSGVHPRESLAGEGGTLRSAAAGFERGRKRSGRSRAYFAPVRRRRPRAHSPGVAARRGRLPRAEGHGNHARRAAPERRAQRIRGAGSDSQPHGGRGRRLSIRPCPASRAKWSSPRTRRCPPDTTASTPD